MAWNEPGPNRDPWNQGPKRGGGPPDLDELVKRLKGRLMGKGGNGGSGGGDGGPSAGGGVPKGLVTLLAAGLAVLWGLSGFYVVDEQQQGVVLRFGEYVKTNEAGLRWHVPWPVEQVEVVNVTGVRSISESSTMLTQDENIVDLDLTVQYRLSDVEDYLFSVAEPDRTLRQATQSAVREVVGTSEMDYIITGGRQEVADRTKQLLQEKLDDYQAGLFVTEVNLRTAKPPTPVQSAFDDAIKAREDQVRLVNEAQAYASDRLPRARGAAARLVEEAKAYREQVVSKAEGDASRFSSLLTEYRQAPQVTRERLYLDAMSQVYGSTSKVLVDVDSNAPMFYLPLDQLNRAGGTTRGAVAPSTGSSGSSAVTAPSVPSLTRDPSRDRDRSR
ncbi:FtsH protease activity modulator HflK [Flagellatimonas centrodinii]|uniref:FtsH protease activity modulator HflK n=1 Tax=Flagellatimonas centrodinii TaxID=2806210 RepID=UPI001FEF0196|nr:FtsH protease activity modulator HflK [Flagellatimonas centrodinii]ULQ45750.1 FtsH protease activity modulator HflK [Flagellatimonas centrodinii]